MSDLPHTLYNMANKKPKISDVEDAERKMREAYEKKRKEKEREGYTVEELFEGKDAVGNLDVSVLQDYLLGPVLGIGDPRTDKRIDFIGGIRGLSELEKRADSDMHISFSMYPTSITELFDVADQELLMPPKSTWFEPKLRSGLFIHEI